MKRQSVATVNEMSGQVDVAVGLESPAQSHDSGIDLVLSCDTF